MIQMTYVAMATAALMLGAVGANEMMHGDLAEGMGLGHRHMADYGGYHCSAPGDEHHSAHMEHMHNGTHGGDDHCHAGHMDGHQHGHMGSAHPGSPA